MRKNFNRKIKKTMNKQYLHTEIKMERKIKKIKKEINNIISLKDESIDIILDSYEIEIECYEFIKSRDETWFAMF